jgi:uncharacterized protein (TIGR00252 family)
MTNYATGHQAEKDAAEYLKSQGFKIVELNWKTKYCEIDIIAKKNDTLYFVEVKYRKNNAHGEGIEYITQKKLKQMHFAANMWLSNNDNDLACSLAAISASPLGFEFIEIYE